MYPPTCRTEKLVPCTVVKPTASGAVSDDAAVGFLYGKLIVRY
jgi:hypothetical protein